MTKCGLYVRLEAKKGKEDALERFLKGALPLVEDEEDTIAWFALQLDESTYAIFDTFADESGRQAHLTGKVAKALMDNASDLLENVPVIERIDVIADKLPGVGFRRKTSDLPPEAFAP